MSDNVTATRLKRLRTRILPLQTTRLSGHAHLIAIFRILRLVESPARWPSPRNSGIRASRSVTLGGFQNMSNRWHTQIPLGAQAVEGRWLAFPRTSRCVHDLQAVLNPNAPHDSVYVILYGLLGKVKRGGDLLVCESLTYKGHDLLLPPCQTEIEIDSCAWDSHSLPRKSSKEMRAQLGRTDGLSLGHRADSGDDFRGGGILE